MTNAAPITVPAPAVIHATDEFRAKAVRPNELCQKDFTHLKDLGRGWLHLCTILSDRSRNIDARKLRTTMKARGMTATLELVRKSSGCGAVTLVKNPAFSAAPAHPKTPPQR